MDFDREYNKARRPETVDDFTDSNVQALVEGRRKHPLPRPNLSRPTELEIARARQAQDAADAADRVRRSYLGSL